MDLAAGGNCQKKSGSNGDTCAISVIIVNYNGEHLLSRCLSALMPSATAGVEVVVVDNGSTDGSLALISEQYPMVRTIALQKNHGYAGGVNAGINASCGEFVLTLNTDTIPQRDFLTHLVHVMRNDPAIGMCAPKMVFPDGRINSAGIRVSRSGASWDRGMFEPDIGQYDHQEEVFGPCGGSALYRRVMLQEIGLFDEEFFLYMEDVDVAFRAHLAGWLCVYVPDAVVVHLHGGTSGFRSAIAVYYGNRNILWYPFKDFPPIFLLTSLPWILGRTIALIPYYAYHGKLGVILKAKWDGLIGVPGMLRKRQRVTRRVPSRAVTSFVKMWARIPKGELAPKKFE
ncbi:MAG: glycosyltransferase family 2 protein [Methanomicrobiales archaeon]|nr:glycosyltransferase family 2 protein [Methanomicrobiales archaeon]